LDTAVNKRFSRDFRLTGPSDYQRVFKRARRFSSSGFTILIRANDFEQPRLGLIVSKKCARRAVQRNKIKRQVRESFRQQLANLGNFDIVVMAKPILTDMANQDIRHLLVKHWIEISQCAD
jgi:ribonuclease P protein component